MECSNVTAQLSWQLNCPVWSKVAAAKTLQYIWLDSFLGERRKVRISVPWYISPWTHLPQNIKYLLYKYNNDIIPILLLCWNILRKDGYCDSWVDPASSKAILFLLSFLKNNLKYKNFLLHPTDICSSLAPPCGYFPTCSLCFLPA